MIGTRKPFMRILRTYVAGAFIHKNDVEALEENLKIALGKNINIVSQWRTREEAHGVKETDAENAYYDLDELSACNLFIALIDDFQYAYRGTFTELGYALGSNIPVFVLTHPDALKLNTSDKYLLAAANNVFFHHPDVNLCFSFDELVEALRELL